MQRTLLTILAVAAAITMVAVFALREGDDRPTTEPTPPRQVDVADQADDQPQPDDGDAAADADGPDAGQRPADRDQADDPGDGDTATADGPDAPDTDDTPAADAANGEAGRPPGQVDISKLSVEQIEPVNEKVTLGSLAPPSQRLSADQLNEADRYLMQVSLARWGAAVYQIKLADYYQSWHRKPDQHYVVQQGRRIGRLTRYPLAARYLIVSDQAGNTQQLRLDHRDWRLVDADPSAATFALHIMQGDTKVLRLVRRYSLALGTFELQLEQSIANLSGERLTARFVQYGPIDLDAEGGYMGDKRTVALGYLATQDEEADRVWADDFRYSHGDFVSDDDYQQVWPNPTSVEDQLALVWVAIANRYFAAIVHAPPTIEPAGENAIRYLPAPLDRSFETVRREPPGGGDDLANVTVTLSTGEMSLAPAGTDGASRSFDIMMFAGPQAPEVFDASPMYTALGLKELIVYTLGCWCCTFQSIAHALLWFLTWLHSLVLDWGVAIVILVVIVRAILHPITKRSQVNMMKFGRQMQALQPEIEKLKKKYADDQSRLNQEMMKLYREKGVNPAAMAMGCLPMFLQMPIWVALYAMLYFAIELRHEQAFYGVFQAIAPDWNFLADLSAPDQFIDIPDVNLIFFTLGSINILPILMAGVFFVQQKFMQPPQANASEQAQQQQKIMRFMTLLFPIFLYPAPSGLTLYILASTGSGIVDSYFVRKHLKQQEAEGTLFNAREKKAPKPGGFMDRIQKAAEAKRKQLEQQQRKIEQMSGPQRKGKGKGKGKGGKGQGRR